MYTSPQANMIQVPPNATPSVTHDELCRGIQVQDQIARLENNLNRLNELQVSLEKALSPILRLAPEPCGGSDKKDGAQLVPLAECLNGLREKAYAIGNNLDSMLSRIEL